MESYYMKLYIFIANKFGGRKMGIIINYFFFFC